MNAPLPTSSDSTGSPAWSRRRFLGTAAGAAIALPALSSRASGATAPLDITFYEVGDPHYQAFDSSSYYNLMTRASLQKMAALTASTPMPGPGTVGSAIAVINVGDIVDSGVETDPATGIKLSKTVMLEAQWKNYVAEFGLLGTEPNTLVKLPVYEGYGNHDQDGFLKQVSDRIGARAMQLPNITAQSGTYTYTNAWGNISVTGVHYAWKWGPFHFIQTNLRVGDGPERYPCSGSYSFLKNYLETRVGSSGEPVFVVVHLPPTADQENEWPVADRQAFYDLIRRYNTVGILNGHTHAYAHFDWRGPSGTGTVPIRVYQCDSLHNNGPASGIFNVIRIVGSATDPTKATIYVAQRLRNDTWGKFASREISLSYNPPAEPDALNVLTWSSVNTHNGQPCALPMGTAGFVEPRQGGLRRVEVLFDKTITLSASAAAVTVTGVGATGTLTPASLGITVTTAVAASGKTLVITFSSGGAVPLPNAANWRLTLNRNAITGAGGTLLPATADLSRVVGALRGDSNGDGRVTGTDLNQISNIPGFDPASTQSLRADIDGSGTVGSTDLASAWAGRNDRTDILPTP